MKRSLILLLVFLLVVALIPGMAAEESGRYTNVIDPNVQRTIVDKVHGEDGMVPENPVVEGENPFTGLPYEGEYIPIFLSISNNKGARPQWGIDKADLIYEVPLHGNSITRLLGVFMSNHPEEVGPVRSARRLHVDLREEWDSAIMYAGERPEEDCTDDEFLPKAFIKYGVTTTLKGIRLNYDLNGSSQGAYNTKRVKYHTAPNNLSVDLTRFIESLSVYPFTERPWKFSDNLPVAGEFATKIGVFYDNYHSDAYYEYDTESNLYYRFCDNKPFVDYFDQETQLGYANVIIQRVSLSFYMSAYDRPNATLIGEGAAEIFMGGRYIAGKWIRDTLQDRTVFLDEEGNEIAFQRGVTWITICGEKTEISYE